MKHKLLNIATLLLGVTVALCGIFTLIEAFNVEKPQNLGAYELWKYVGMELQPNVSTWKVLVNELTASGSFEAASSSFSTVGGAGLVDCDTAASSKLLWDATNQVFSCGTDQSGAAGDTSAHGLLNQDIHTDTTMASASAGSLILGDADSWDELTIGASSSYLISDGATAKWNDLFIDISRDTNLTAGDHITLTGDDLDIDDDFLLDTGDEGTYVSLSVGFSSVEANIASLSADTYWGAGLADCDTAATSKVLYSDTGVFSCGTDANTTYTAGDNLTLTVADFDLDPIISITGASISADLDVDDLNATSASFGTITGAGLADCDADTSAILWSDTGVFSCGDDDNTTYTGGDMLTLTGTDFDIDDPFTVVTLTGTHVSASGDFDTPSASITSGSFGTVFGAGLVDCDTAATSKLLWSDTGVFSCGTDQTAAGTIAAHNLLSDTHNDTTEASVSAGSLILGDADSWDELAIGASQSFLMSNGTTAFWADYSDQNTTYTAGDNLTLTLTDFDLDPIISITGASISDDLDLGDLNVTSASAGTFNATTLTEAGIAVLNNDEMDASSELLTIIDDETGSGHIVFDTSPQFETSFTTVGIFAINPGGALTIGDGGDTLLMNSSDWDISVTGDMTGIGGITMNGTLLASGSAQFTTGTVEFDNGASMSGNFTANGGSSVWDLGGVGSFEIPNGIAPVTTTVGRIALDTTDNQLIVGGGDDLVFTATKSVGWGIASASATEVKDSSLIPYDFTITSASCFSGNTAGEIIIVDIYECSSAGVCGEHINTASVSCDMDATSFALNDSAGDKWDKYRFKVQSTNDSCENTDQILVNLEGFPTRK